MSTNPTNNDLDRYHELMQKYFEAEVSESEANELLSLLDRDASLQTEFIMDIHLENALASCLKTHSFDSIVNGHGNLHTNQNEARPHLGISEAISRFFSSKSFYERIVFWSSSTVAILFVVFCFYFEFVRIFDFPLAEMRRSDQQNQPKSIAKITDTMKVYFVDGSKHYKRGQNIGTESIRFKSGVMELALENGVRLVLEGNVDFRLFSEMKGYCKSGRVSATVPPNAKKFKIVTPDLTVIDLGTRFILDVSDTNVEVHTIDGLVEVLSEQNHEGISLHAGNAIKLVDNKFLSEAKADPLLFFTEKKMKQVSEKWENELKARMEKQRSCWSRFSHLLVDFDFETVGDSVINQAARAAEVGNGRLLGGLPCKGRWNGVTAYSFQKKNDCVEINVNQSLHSATLYASVQVDDIKHYGQCIFASREFARGSLFWQITRDGSIRLGIQSEKDCPPLEFQTEKVFTHKKMGAWYQIAVVIDHQARSVDFYVDGRKVSSHKYEMNTHLHIGRATIGNGFWQGKGVTSRVLNGRIDRFLLFDHALTGEEIRDLTEIDN